MKTLFFLSAILFSLSFFNACSTRSGSSQQQSSIIEAEFTVAGNCGMCKTRIEDAAKEAGAESAQWHVEHQVLHVSFDENKTTLEKIQKQIAAAGHDNEAFRAEDDVYESLHSCCNYERIQ